MLAAFLGVIGVVLVFWLQWRIKNRELLKAAEQFPGPPTVIGLGNAWQLMCNPAEIVPVLRNLLVEYGDIMKIWLGPELNILINNPDDTKSLLTNPKTSCKGPQYKYMKATLGEGILSGSGPVWRNHRKLATPSYAKSAVLNYSNVFNKEVGLLLEKYREKQNIQIDLHDYIAQASCYVICQTMGLTKEQTMNLPHLQKIIDLTPRWNEILFDKMTKWYFQIEPLYRLTSYHQEMKQCVQMVHEFSSEIIRCRKEYLKTLTENYKKDLMQLEEDTQLSVIDRFILSGEFNKEELIHETITIFTTAQDSVAEISSFTLLMCAYHPKVQAKLYKEIREVVGDSDRDVTDEDLKKMTYLDMVLKETLRLFPAAAIMQRTALEDIPLGKRVIPKGCSLVFPVYHMQRDPRYWDNPDAFDPERFSPENIKKVHSNCYMPFSMGPMDCLGRFYATTIIKTLCVRVLREFEIVSQNKYEDLRLSFAISVVSVDGFYATLRPRRI